MDIGKKTTGRSLRNVKTECRETADGISSVRCVSDLIHELFHIIHTCGLACEKYRSIDCTDTKDFL